jgi:hypothetical protein
MTAQQFERLTKNATTAALLECKTTAKRTERLYDAYFAGRQTAADVTRLYVELQRIDAESQKCRDNEGCQYHKEEN